VILLLFLAVCLTLLLWDSGGQFDVVSGFVLVLVIWAASGELRRRLNPASRWSEGGPAYPKRHWSDHGWGIALLLVLLSVPLADWYGLPQAPSMILFVVLIVAVGIRGFERRAQRVSGIQIWCFRRGYRFYEQGYSALRSELKGVRLPYWDLHAAPAVLGTYEGLRFLAFEYHEQDETRGDERGTVVTVFSGQRLRPMYVRRRDPDDRKTDGVRLELAAFNQAFRVEAQDPRWAFKVLSQDSMEYLLSEPLFDEIRLRDEALTVLHRTPLQADGIQSALRLAHDLLGKIPST
jgi:hypothetical protein